MHRDALAESTSPALQHLQLPPSELGLYKDWQPEQQLEKLGCMLTPEYRQTEPKATREEVELKHDTKHAPQMQDVPDVYAQRELEPQKTQQEALQAAEAFSKQKSCERGREQLNQMALQRLQAENQELMATIKLAEDEKQQLQDEVDMLASRLSKEKRRAQQLQADMHEAQATAAPTPRNGSSSGHLSGLLGVGSGSAQPLSLLLLGSYDAVDMEFGPGEQDQQISRFAKEVNSFADKLLQESHRDSSLYPKLKGLILSHIQQMLPAGGQLSSHQDPLASGTDMRPLVRHLLLQWLIESVLWQQPLRLAGLHSNSHVLEVAAWGGSTAEMEAALQLDAAAYKRVAKALLASSCLASRRGQACHWLEQNISGALDNKLVPDFCMHFGIPCVVSSSYLVRQLLAQAYQLRTCMGAAHPELRPYLTHPGAALHEGLHHCIRLTELPMQQQQGSTVLGGTPPVVLASRAPGWYYLTRGRERPARREEVIAARAMAQAEGGSAAQKAACSLQ